MEIWEAGSPLILVCIKFEGEHSPPDKKPWWKVYPHCLNQKIKPIITLFPKLIGISYWSTWQSAEVKKYFQSYEAFYELCTRLTQPTPCLQNIHFCPNVNLLWIITTLSPNNNFPSLFLTFYDAFNFTLQPFFIFPYSLKFRLTKKYTQYWNCTPSGTKGNT